VWQKKQAKERNCARKLVRSHHAGRVRRIASVVAEREKERAGADPQGREGERVARGAEESTVNWNHVGPRRGKQRTALIEATRIVAHTMKRVACAHTCRGGARASECTRASSYYRSYSRCRPFRASCRLSLFIPPVSRGYTHSCPFGESGNERKAHTGEYGRSWWLPSTLCTRYARTCVRVYFLNKAI